MPPLLDASKSFRHRLLLLLLLLSRCRWCPKSLLEFQPALFLYFVVGSRAAFVVHWWWTCSRRICCLSALFSRATTTTWPWRELVAPAAATHSFNWSYSHLAPSVRLPVLCRIINCDDSDSRCRSLWKLHCSWRLCCEDHYRSNSAICVCMFVCLQIAIGQ